MKLSILLSVLLSFSTFASEKIVYMKIENDERQIAIANSDGSQERLITTNSKWHLYPDISADGKQVVYVEGEDGRNLNLIIQNLESGLTEVWNMKPGFYIQPKFSKNGRYLVFSGPLGKQDSSRVGIIDLDKAREQSVVDNIVTETERRVQYQVRPEVLAEEHASYFPNMSSDGSFLIYQRTKVTDGQKNREIVLVDRHSGKSEKIIDGMAPALSFDDRWIAFTSQKTGDWEIYVYDRHTKAEYRVTQTLGNDFAPTFNRHGDVVFASERSGDFQIYKVAKSDWMKNQENAQPLIIGSTSFYTPRLSGETAYRQMQATPFLSPAVSSFGSIKHDDKVYIVGGHQGAEHTYPPESFSNRVMVYDLKTKEWKYVASRNYKAHGFSLAVSGKYIYAFGGFAYSANHKPRWKSLDIIERYDTEKDVWEVVGKLPRRRSSNVVVTVGKKVYLIGGWDSTPKFENDYDGTFHRAIDVFDLETETAYESEKLSLPDPLRRAFTGVEFNQNIYLIGGLGVGATHFELLDNVTKLNPVTGESTELPRLPFATFAPAAGFLGTSLYVFGGMFKTGEMSYEYVSHIYGHRIGSDKWFNTGRFLNESKGFSQVVPLSRSTLMILGGHSYEDGKDEPVTTVEIFQ